MPINTELRSQGIGASEIAAILGLDPRRDAFSIWARKLNLIPEPESNVRMRKGKYFERGIVDWYADETESKTQWSDTTMQPREDRPWQIVTPDAFVLPIEGPIGAPAIGGVDAKLVAFDQRDKWGEAGSTNVPDHYGIQCQWTTSAFSLPWWDIAGAIGDELRVYRIERDPAIEATLLEVGEKFWKTNVLGRVEPPIGANDAAAEYIKTRFPKNVHPLRTATPEEVALLSQYRDIAAKWDEINRECTIAENRLKLAIGEDEGLLAGEWKVTFKKDKDSMGPDWRAIAHDLAQRLEMLRMVAGPAALEGDGQRLRELIADIPATMAWFEKQYEIITRHGPRKLRATWGKGK